MSNVRLYQSNWKEEKMPAYIICRVSVENPSVLKAYQAVAPAIIEKYKGKFIVKGRASVTLEGPTESRIIVVLEFPELTDAEAFYNSPENTEARKLREGLATFEFVAVQGL
jgi:uncharacterized protein (DUF1330 family)